MITAQPAQTIGLDPHADHLSIRISEKMRRQQTTFGRQPWFAFEDQRLMIGKPFRAQEKIGKCGMRLVSPRVR